MDNNIAGWRIDRAGENVLFLVGFGTWSKQDALSFTAVYRDAVSDFGGGPWAVLGDATDWCIDDSEVQNVIRDQNRWILQAGCRAGAFYTGPGAMNRLLLYRLSEPDSDAYRFRVHPHRQRAVEALSSEGFHISDHQLSGFFRGDGRSF